MLTAYHKKQKPNRPFEQLSVSSKEDLSSVEDEVDGFIRCSEFEWKEEIRIALVKCILDKDRCLCLSGLCITDNNIIKSLVPFLKRNPQIKEIELNSNDINDEGIIYLVENCHLERIDCGNNNIDSGGVIALAQNKHLISLNVCGISFDSSSENRLEVFCVLAANPALKELFLCVDVHVKYESPVDDEAVKILASSQSLIKLVLCGNNISDEGIKAFEHNKTLMYLNIADTNVTDIGRQLLKSYKILSFEKEHELKHLKGGKKRYASY
jgi:hypothetical protein